MLDIPEPLFLSKNQMNPDFEWVNQGKGEATVWWDTATLYFKNGEPILEGDITDEMQQQVLEEARKEGLTNGYYYVCGPNIQDNLYCFSKITFIALGSVKLPFAEIRNLINIKRFLKTQGYRGIVFVNRELEEHNACFVNLEQIQ